MGSQRPRLRPQLPASCASLFVSSLVSNRIVALARVCLNTAVVDKAEVFREIVMRDCPWLLDTPCVCVGWNVRDVSSFGYFDVFSIVVKRYITL